MTSTPKTTAIEKQMLEEELGNLTAQYTVVMRQRQNERDALAKLQLKKQADGISNQMKQVEEELKGLENLENNSYQNYLDIQETLPEIDFKRAVSIVETVTNKFGTNGGAALFLLENSYSLAGYLLISKIRDKFKRQTRNFRHIKIELSPSGNYNEYTLLDRLAEYLNYQAATNLTAITDIEEIIKKVCQSLQTGSILFLEINKWNTLEYQEKLIPWFIDEFWIPLIKQCQITAQQKDLRRIKLITIIDSESQLNSEYTNLPYYCGEDNFDSNKILRLPLNSWTQLDIEEWLDYYSGKPASEIDLIAKQIYAKTMSGIPLMVCEALKNIKY